MDLAKHRPPALSGVLERERLLSKLAYWSDRKLVIIHGPAGQGKSTLAADYVRSLGLTPLWYSLDASDDDPVIFLERIGQLVRQLYPRETPAVPALPWGGYRDKISSAVITQWISGLFQHVSSGLLVFDDYQVLAESPRFPMLLNMLIESTAPSVRVMVLSRTKPALSLGRLRLKRSVGELNGTDLRFTEAEVHDLYGSAFGSRLSLPEAVNACRVTEGWIAGLVLLLETSTATIEKRPYADVNQLLPAFQDQLYDYFSSEVFNHLDSGLQDFMLRTSIAAPLSPAFAGMLANLPIDAPQGQNSVASMLAELAKRNLFADIRCEDTVVRYHPLFRNFLNERLSKQLHPTEFHRIYRTAANFCIGSRDAVQAIEILIASEQFEQAANLIERSCPRLVGRGQIKRLHQAIGKLPDSMQDRPWLLFIRAVARRYSEPKAALIQYERACAGFRSKGNRVAQMMSLSGIIESCFHGGGLKRIQRAIIQARPPLRKSKGESRSARGSQQMAIGIALFFAGRLQEGRDALSRAMEFFRSTGDHFFCITCAIYLTPCALFLGDFALAAETIRRGSEAKRLMPEEPGGAAALHLVRALESLYQNNFIEANKSLERCRRLADEHRIESLSFLMLALSGWLKVKEGDFQNAQHLFEMCIMRLEASGRTHLKGALAYFLSVSHLFLNNIEKAKELSGFALSSHDLMKNRLLRSACLMVRGSIHQKLRKYRRAEQDLLTAIRVLKQCKAAPQEAHAHLLLTYLYLESKAPRKALHHLRCGFAIGQESRLTSSVLFGPGELRNLARHAVDQGICTDYCTHLLAGSERAVPRPLLRIYCLGGFQAYHGGIRIQEREWNGKRTKQLIKLLASRLGKPLSRDTVIDIFRPDGDPKKHSDSVSSMLHRARKALDRKGRSEVQSTCIRYDTGNFSFNRSMVWTDVETFQSAINEAHRAEKLNDLVAALQHYDNALSLYQGDFLPEDLYEDWIAPTRDLLQTTYLKALERTADITSDLGDMQNMTLRYEQLFLADQCNEKACRWLMTRALAEGRRSEAIRVFERCQLALQRELDIEPDEKTRRLYRSIIGG